MISIKTPFLSNPSSSNPYPSNIFIWFFSYAFYTVGTLCRYIIMYLCTYIICRYIYYFTYHVMLKTTTKIAHLLETSHYYTHQVKRELLCAVFTTFLHRRIPNTHFLLSQFSSPSSSFSLSFYLCTFHSIHSYKCVQVVTYVYKIYMIYNLYTHML